MKLLNFFGYAALVFLLTQCYPEGPVYTDELDLVYSNYDPSYNFKAKHTFAMPDKIMKIDDNLINGGTPTFVKEPYATQMLDMIRQNMSNNGWSEVEAIANPDVQLMPVAMEVTTTVYWGYGGYWDWWYGGWYGWYYPYPVVTNYSTGSLIVTMVDPNDLSPDDKARATWTFIVNGLLEGSDSQIAQRAIKGIDQAFTQSTYLKLN